MELYRKGIAGEMAGITYRKLEELKRRNIQFRYDMEDPKVDIGL